MTNWLTRSLSSTSNSFMVPLVPRQPYSMRLDGRGWRRQRGTVVACLRRRRTALGEAHAQAVEIQIDDRGGEQGQCLAEKQSSDHGISQWLTQFRTGAATEHERQ